MKISLMTCAKRSTPSARSVEAQWEAAKSERITDVRGGRALVRRSRRRRSQLSQRIADLETSEGEAGDIGKLFRDSRDAVIHAKNQIIDNVNDANQKIDDIQNDTKATADSKLTDIRSIVDDNTIRQRRLPSPTNGSNSQGSPAERRRLSTMTPRFSWFPTTNPWRQPPANCRAAPGPDRPGHHRRVPDLTLRSRRPPEGHRRETSSLTPPPPGSRTDPGDQHSRVPAWRTSTSPTPPTEPRPSRRSRQRQHPPSPVGLAFPECPAPQALPVRHLLPVSGHQVRCRAPRHLRRLHQARRAPPAPRPATPQQQLTEFQKAMAEAATRAAQTPIAPTQPAASLGSAPIAQPPAAPPVLDAPAGAGANPDHRRPPARPPAAQHRCPRLPAPGLPHRDLLPLGPPPTPAPAAPVAPAGPVGPTSPRLPQRRRRRRGSPCASPGFSSTRPPRGSCRGRDSRCSAPSLDRQ